MATSCQINVIVLSPCELYRQAWKSLLASLVSVNCIQAAATVSEIALSRDNGYPLTILVDAPGSERRFALQLEPYYKNCFALFVVNNYALPTILPLLKLGVIGFTARDESVSKLVRTFRTTAKGQISLPLETTNRAVTELANGRRPHASLASDLTRRETEILQLLSDGLSNRDIAQTLFLSVRTVESHLRSLYGKLEVKSRTEAALWAVRHGYAPFNNEPTI